MKRKNNGGHGAAASDSDVASSSFISRNPSSFITKPPSSSDSSSLTSSSEEPPNEDSVSCGCSWAKFSGQKRCAACLLDAPGLFGFFVFDGFPLEPVIRIIINKNLQRKKKKTYFLRWDWTRPALAAKFFSVRL